MNKTEYLAARAAQKKAYNELSEQIRETRSQYNMEQQVFSSFPPGEPRTQARIWYNEALTNLNETRCELQKLRTQATKLINKVHSLKEEAHNVWLEKKEQTMS